MELYPISRVSAHVIELLYSAKSNINFSNKEQAKNKATRAATGDFGPQK